ncbi:hypothetical protein HGA91_05635 [candidate division WWE3 bacterium]|nr:hypothetical protein [candidate division WWE3 bacterium]
MAISLPPGLVEHISRHIDRQKTRHNITLTVLASGMHTEPTIRRIIIEHDDPQAPGGESRVTYLYLFSMSDSGMHSLQIREVIAAGVNSRDVERFEDIDPIAIVGHIVCAATIRSVGAQIVFVRAHDASPDSMV